MIVSVAECRVFWSYAHEKYNWFLGYIYSKLPKKTTIESFENVYTLLNSVCSYVNQSYV